MTIAVQSLGLVMALLTVKIRLTAVILPATIMMAVTVVALMVVLMVALSLVMTVNLTGHLMDLNAVILHGMSMALIVLHWKVITTGIVLVVAAQVMRLLYVVTVPVLVTKIVNPAKLIAAYAANVVRVR